MTAVATFGFDMVTANLTSSLVGSARALERATQTEALLATLQRTVNELADAIKVSIVVGENALLQTAVGEHAIETLLDLEDQSEEVVAQYVRYSHLLRHAVASIDGGVFLHNELEPVITTLGGDVDLSELLAAHEARRDLIRRMTSTRAALVERIEDLDDLVAALESEREQGSDALVAHDELALRLGFGTPQ